MVTGYYLIENNILFPCDIYILVLLTCFISIKMYSVLVSAFILLLYKTSAYTVWYHVCYVTQIVDIILLPKTITIGYNQIIQR